MKRKIWVTAGIAAALAFLIAFGAVGCVVSGFDLPLDSYAKVVLICGAASVFCAAAFSLKWGGAAVLCALALGAGYVWKQDEAAEQLFGLLYRMTSVYGNAYGWDPVQLADGAAAVDIPMAVLGVLLSAAVTWSVCRKLGAVLPVAASLIPLSACMVVTDTVPDVQYLFCLLFGLIILILTGRVPQTERPSGQSPDRHGGDHGGTGTGGVVSDIPTGELCKSLGSDPGCHSVVVPEHPRKGGGKRPAGSDRFRPRSGAGSCAPCVSGTQN